MPFGQLLQSASYISSFLSSSNQNSGLPQLAVDGKVTSDIEDLRRFTSVRWLYDEDKHTKPRYINFDPFALCNVASDLVGTKCIRINKVAEGTSNKVLLLTFDDGQEIIARLPCPVAGPPHLITASEVATMEFARSILGIPVPKVLAWCSKADESSVGAEYILMEKAPGVVLEDIWENLGLDQRKTIVTQLTDIQLKFSTVQFSHYGNLYFRNDVQGYPHTDQVFVDPAIDSETGSKFSIGPSVHWELWRGTRAKLNVDRGPWKDRLSWITGLIRCQQEKLKKSSGPRHPSDPGFLDEEDGSPDVHIAVLEQLLSCFPAIMPNIDLCSPVLWHTDLNRGNIFVDPSTCVITSIIDWQWTKIAPLYIQAVLPHAFAYVGDDIEVSGDFLTSPRLPRGTRNLPDDQQDYLRAQLHDAYTMTWQQRIINLTHPWGTIQSIPHLELILDPIRRAPRTWTDGLTPLRFMMLEIQDNWDQITHGEPCPLHFSEEERAHIMHLTEKAALYESMIHQITEELHVDDEGMVETSRYNEVLQICEKLKLEWDAKEMGGPFPLQSGRQRILVAE
ncbi:kinase-like domain-containing protein [Abortiporus biennis]|nr:kinase-like domain-containing protein [Abortiporus biennis]